MFETTKRKTYYEMDFIDKVVCDNCRKNITKENGFGIEISFKHLDRDGKYYSKVFDNEPNCWIHICKECAGHIVNLPTKAEEYIQDGIAWDD